MSLWINGEWRPGRGPGFSKQDPVNLKVVWQGEAADAGQVAEAVAAARQAFPSWARLPFAARQAIVEKFAALLEASKADLVSVKAELETQKKQLSAQREEANKLVKEIDDNAAEYQATLDELEADEARIRRQAQQLQKQLEEQMKAQGKNYNTNPGGYIWPVDSRYITSTVGGRSSPGGVGSTNHKGTDIGRVGYTSPVYAAKAGTVIVAQRSSSYGNYVVISHGTGNTTLYAHMSSIKVSVGTYVQQGQTIGITGSTGHSTGPHLHFEILHKGLRYDPAQALQDAA